MQSLRLVLIILLAGLIISGKAMTAEESMNKSNDASTVMKSKENTSAGRQNISFASQGTTIRAWYYPPANQALTAKEGAPAVVMGHGLSMTKDCGLTPYAERFSKEGMHVLVIDYRGFGESDGMPRDIVSVKMQIQDYLAAVDQVRGMPGVDPKRVVLWGTSYSGGIVIDAAVRDGKIAAVISQCPNLDNLATAYYQFRLIPLSRSIWVSYSTVVDFVKGLFGGQPYYVRAVGKPGDSVSSAYVSEESAMQVARIAGPTWNNRLANRDFMHLPPFRPITKIKKLPCKFMLLVSARDDLLPPATQLKAAEIAGDNCELVKYPVNHFGIYIDEPLKDALEKQTDFLLRQLRK